MEKICFTWGDAIISPALHHWSRRETVRKLNARNILQLLFDVCLLVTVIIMWIGIFCSLYIAATIDTHIVWKILMKINSTETLSWAGVVRSLQPMKYNPAIMQPTRRDCFWFAVSIIRVRNTMNYFHESQSTNLSNRVSRCLTLRSKEMIIILYHLWILGILSVIWLYFTVWTSYYSEKIRQLFWLIAFDLYPG